MKIQRSPNANYALDCVENALNLRWIVYLAYFLTHYPVFLTQCPVLSLNVLFSSRMS